MGLENTRSDTLWALWSKRVKVFLQSYLVGMIVTLHLYFLAEWLVGMPMFTLFWTLTVSVFVPMTAAITATLIHIHSESAPLQEGSSLPIVSQVWRHFHWLITGVLLFGVWSGLYYLAAYLIKGDPTHSLYFFLDDYFYFRPEFVFVYLSVYWLFLLGVFGARSPDESLAILKSGVLLVIISTILHIGFPVEVPRPDFATTTFSEWTLAIVYASDRPVNCFPSMHCAMVMLAGLAILERNRRNGLLVMALIFEIGLSTIFTGQHFVVDILFGYALAFLAYILVFKNAKGIIQEKVPQLYKSSKEWFGQTHIRE